MRPRSIVWGAALLGLAVGPGCHRSPDALGEARALEARGSLEEAANKYDLVCAFSPAEAACLEADGRASQLRYQAAEKAIAGERFIEADRLLHLALITGNGAAQLRASTRLSQPDLTQGLEFERALERLDKKRTYAALERLSASGAEIGARASDWLAVERPAIVAARVREACQPPPSDPLAAAVEPRSCTDMEAEIKKLTPGSPEAATAAQLREVEIARITPLAAQADGMLASYAERGRLVNEYRKCLDEKRAEEIANPKIKIADDRSRSVACTNEVYGRDEPEKRKSEDDLWRRLMRSIRDPKLTAPLELKRRQLSSGAIDAGSVPVKAPEGAAAASTGGTTP